MAIEPGDHNVQNPTHIPAKGEDYIWSEGDLSVFEGAERVEDVYDLEGTYVGSMVYWPQEGGQEGEVEWVEADDIKGEVEER